MTATEGQHQPNITTRKQAQEVFLWSYITVETLCCIIGVFGNGMVIYLANQNRQREAFRYLNKVVRNLAVTDFLYCVLAIPVTLLWWIWSKT